MSLAMSAAFGVDTINSPSTRAVLKRCEAELSDGDELAADDLDVAIDGSFVLAVWSHSFCIASTVSLVSSTCSEGVLLGSISVSDEEAGVFRDSACNGIP
jgi:hypothetical protein